MTTLAQILELQQVLAEHLDERVGDIQLRRALTPPHELYLSYGVKVTAERAHHFHVLILPTTGQYSAATRTVQLLEGKWRMTQKWRGIGAGDLTYLLKLLDEHYDNLRY